MTAEALFLGIKAIPNLTEVSGRVLRKTNPTNKFVSYSSCRPISGILLSIKLFTKTINTVSLVDAATLIKYFFDNC